MLKVVSWGATGKFSQPRRPLGGAPGNPGKLWGAVWFWANKKNQVQKPSSTNFFSKPAAAQCQNCFGGLRHKFIN